MKCQVLRLRQRKGEMHVSIIRVSTLRETAINSLKGTDDRGGGGKKEGGTGKRIDQSKKEDRGGAGGLDNFLEISGEKKDRRTGSRHHTRKETKEPGL